MFPIAWAQVEAENRDTWSWFLEHLKTDLRMGDGVDWAIISDQQKGLVRSIADTFPSAEHRCCARHILCKWRRKHKGEEFAEKFWACAKSHSIRQFEDNLQELKDMSEEACHDILEVHPGKWCRAYFKTTIKCDIVGNMLSGTFKVFMVPSRHKDIIDMFDDIRVMVMNRLHARYGEAINWKENIGPRIKKYLEHNKVEACKCSVHANGADAYEVTEGIDMFVVDLIERSYTCRAWDVSGIPCAHACAAILNSREDHEKYVHQYLHQGMVAKSYANMLRPLVGKRDWPKTGKNDVLPPDERKIPESPKKKRARAEFEVSVRTGQLKTCKECHEQGHSRSSCPKLEKVGENFT